jgi:hypothetical protein
MSATKGIVLTVLAVAAVFCFSIAVMGTPVGPNTITYVENKTHGITAAASRSADERGTIVTVRMNVSQQSLYWKAYVGNVTGKITLDDDLNYTIYDWTLSILAGEVYATRKSTTVGWGTVRCANNTVIETEASVLNHTIQKSDSINKTFRRNNHTAFFAGNVPFAANSCNHTVHTYVSDAVQKSSFSEVLLYDTSGYIVYTSILNDSAKGYNNEYYDFQMLVGEKGQDGSVTPLSYYFYVELT